MSSKSNHGSAPDPRHASPWPLNRGLVPWLALAFASAIQAQNVFVESGDNNLKSTATLADCVVTGDLLTGAHGNPASIERDVWRVRTCPATAGIYRHRLIVQIAVPDYLPTLRGLYQSAGVIQAGTDAAVQESVAGSDPDRFVQWYGFGNGEEVYYDLKAFDFNRSSYSIQIETTPIVATPLANVYQEGLITIGGNGGSHSNDTDLWVYDASFEAIPSYGNDDGASTPSCPAYLQRVYRAGTYHVALAHRDLVPAVSSAFDEGDAYGSVLDFPDAVLASEPDVGVDLSFSVSGFTGPSEVVTSIQTEPFQVQWHSFDVVGDPSFVYSCDGDGSAGPCPCNNDGATGHGCDNSSNTGGAILTARGSSSVATDDLRFTVGGVPPSKQSLILMGSQVMAPVSVGYGLQCIGGTPFRLPVHVPNDSGIFFQGPGIVSFTSSHLPPEGQIQPGQTWTFQATYRDDGACGQATNTSNAVSVSFLP